MKQFNILSAPLIILLVLFPASCIAQDVAADVSQPVKIGLALSSGGAKGFAHVGVLKVLEEEGIPVHIVAGTSMGAVVGGLYAAGYTPQQIQDIALNTDWQALFNDNLKPSSRDLSTFISTRDTYLLSFPIIDKRPRLPAGLVGGQNISMLLYRLFLPYHNIEDFSELPVRFGAITTELSTGKVRRFESGYLPEVIRASAAIPSIFKPVDISGKLYIDGGVARSIPVEDARAMGADIVLASNVGEPVKPQDSLDTFVNVLFQSIGFHQIESDTMQIKLADFYVRPDIEEFNSFSYEKVQELIRRGEEAARSIVPQLKAMLDSVRVAKAPVKPEAEMSGQRFTVTNIDYRNIDGRLLRQTKIALDITPPKTLTYSDIERKINRLYATEQFSLVSYRLKDDSTSADGKVLNIHFTPGKQNRLGFSTRYDSRYQASLLFGIQLLNTLAWGDRFVTSVRLGDILGISSHYDVPIFLKPIVAFNTDLNIHRSPIDFYSVQERLATVEVEQVSLLPSFSMRLFKNIEIKAGLRAEYFHLNESVGDNLLLSDTRFLLNGVASMEYNNLNRIYFPTRGQRIYVTAETTDKQFLSEATFSQLIAEWQASLPVFDGVEIRSRLIAGQSSTSELPFHFRFYQGGLTGNPLFERRQAPLWGYATQQLSGSSLASIRAGLQLHLGNDIYLQGGWNAAHLSESETWNPKDFDFNHGYGISVGALTIIGPVNLSLSTRDFEENYALKVDVGYSF